MGEYMADQKLINEVGKYIDKYYVPGNDDIKMDAEMKSIFDKITYFRKRRAAEKAQRVSEPKPGYEAGKEQKVPEPKTEYDTEKAQQASESKPEYEIDEKAAEEFELSEMQNTKIKEGLSASKSMNRKIEDLIEQMEETFSQRLLRMISERGMTDAEAYSKAYVDRRHFSKIRKDVNYVPNKKTVLAFTIALELSLDEAKDLLASAGFALSRSSKTDIIVAYFLQNKIYNMFEINDVLYAYGQQVFG